LQQTLSERFDEIYMEIITATAPVAGQWCKVKKKKNKDK
jgi:hypothetical protein